MKENKYKGVTETIIAFFIYVAIAGWVVDWNFERGEQRAMVAIVGTGFVGLIYLFSSGKINNL